ncbi:HoxN/HupN/NixA family nickel/cobalt transporter [Sphingomonas sp. UYP23]
MTIMTGSALGLIFILGMRHGLDPDHVAVIDNMTFRAVDERPTLSPWIGGLFAIGHSLSVAAVALTVSLVSGLFAWPDWLTFVVDWLVIALLVLVGTLNLRALLGSETYTPVGWRQRLVPLRLLHTSHPLATVAVGAIFGLVFDTATQAAAWGAAAGAGSGGALIVALTFASGMILTDTADSQIVAYLLRAGGDVSRVRRYRRGVGWAIVALSFGMALYALIAMFAPDYALSDASFSGLGIAMAIVVIGLLLRARRRVFKRYVAPVFRGGP